MAATRSALIESALSLFSQHGYNGVGINDLCQHAGLTRGGFYHHFPSKAALLKALFEESADTNHLMTPSTREPLKALAGSAVASLSLDVARGDAELQQAYAQRLNEIIKTSSRDEEVSIDSASAIVALTIGGLLIDAACGGKQPSLKVSAAVRSALETMRLSDSSSHPKS